MGPGGSGNLCCCLQHNVRHPSAQAALTVNQDPCAFPLAVCSPPGSTGALLGQREAATSVTFYPELRNLSRTQVLKSQVWRKCWSKGSFCPNSSCAASHPEKEEIPYNQASPTSHPRSCAWHGDRDINTAPCRAGALTMVKHRS